MDPLAQARTITLNGSPRQGLSRKIVRTSSSIERPWRAAWRRNCALVASSRLRTVSVAIEMNAMQATLAPQFLPQGPQDAAIVAVALIANPQPVFP